jgi:hypothetical protein
MVERSFLQVVSVTGRAPARPSEWPQIYRGLPTTSLTQVKAY